MEKVIVAGFGGQGVLSLGQMLAYAAMYENMAATWLPSYGPEMRGGTANCSVVLDEKEVASPIIAVPDCLIAMNTPSLFISVKKRMANAAMMPSVAVEAMPSVINVLISWGEIPRQSGINMITIIKAAGMMVVLRASSTINNRIPKKPMSTNIIADTS